MKQKESEPFGTIKKKNGIYSIIDVVAVLTDSVNVTAYWRKLKQRLKAEGNETVTNCHSLKMLAADGKMRLTYVADTKQLLKNIKILLLPEVKLHAMPVWSWKPKQARQLSAH